MALKKSELYSSLWASCDELRGGMDASQYKDFVLVLLFIKYVSDKYAGVPYAPITIPPGASFKDMVALKPESLKKSELYSSLWASCDELRGGMDASQYKDFVLVLLFIKYVSDKYAGVPYAPITIPPGASFKDMVMGA